MWLKRASTMHKCMLDMLDMLVIWHNFHILLYFLQWDAFSFPELFNFLQMLQREEEEHVHQIVKRYALARNKMKQAMSDVSILCWCVQTGLCAGLSGVGLADHWVFFVAWCIHSIKTLMHICFLLFLQVDLMGWVYLPSWLHSQAGDQLLYTHVAKAVTNCYILTWWQRCR